MMKTLAFVAIIFSVALGACTSDPIEKLIPQSLTKGGLSTFTIDDIEVQNGKSRNGGTYVQGTVSVPFDIKKEMIKPTLLAAIKELKGRYKNTEWIAVYAMVSKSYSSVGRAEYAQNKIEIHYDILSDEMLKERNQAAKKDGLEVIRMPTKEEFDQAVLIDKTRQQIYSKILDDELEAFLDPKKRKSKKPRLTQSENFDDIIIEMTAKELGISKDKAIKTRNLLVYYQASFATETIGPLN
jgi:hypothetical protein